MKDKVNISAVVIIPPPDFWGSIQEIRRIYDRNYHRWMPHITLLYPFRPESEFSRLESPFMAVCNNLTPFTLHFQQFKYFSHGHQNYTVWIAPEPKDPIIELQRSILKLVPDCDDVNRHKNGFTPHLSIGQVKGKSKLVNVMKELQVSWKSFKTKINEIYFIARTSEKKSSFEIKKRIPLMSHP